MRLRRVLIVTAVAGTVAVVALGAFTYSASRRANSGPAVESQFAPGTEISFGSSDSLVVPRGWAATWQGPPVDPADSIERPTSEIPRVKDELDLRGRKRGEGEDVERASVSVYATRDDILRMEALFRAIWDTERRRTRPSRSLPRLTKTPLTSSSAFVRWAKPATGGRSYPREILVFVTARGHAPMLVTISTSPESEIVEGARNDAEVVAHALDFLQLDL